jgi:hypothetical protein
MVPSVSQATTLRTVKNEGDPAAGVGAWIADNQDWVDALKS